MLDRDYIEKDLQESSLSNEVIQEPVTTEELEEVIVNSFDLIFLVGDLIALIGLEETTNRIKSMIKEGKRK